MGRSRPEYYGRVVVFGRGEMKQAVLDSHTGEDQLEEYLFERLSASDVASLEEHLLICASCREKMDATRDFVVHARAALKSMPWPETEPMESRRRHRFFLRPVAAPMWAITMAGLAAVALFGPMS